MKYIGRGSAVRSGLLASSVMLLIATFAGTPAFAKSDSKKSKPEKARVERSSGGDSSTRFTAVYGTKTLNKTDWAPADKQTGFGLDVEYVNEDWPVAVLGYYFTGKGAGKALNADLDQDGIVDGDFEATTATTEIGLGARKWLEEGETVTLFVEAGLGSVAF